MYFVLLQVTITTYLVLNVKDLMLFTLYKKYKRYYANWEIP